MKTINALLGFIAMRPEYEADNAKCRRVLRRIREGKSSKGFEQIREGVFVAMYEVAHYQRLMRQLHEADTDRADYQLKMVKALDDVETTLNAGFELVRMARDA